MCIVSFPLSAEGCAGLRAAPDSTAGCVSSETGTWETVGDTALGGSVFCWQPASSPVSINGMQLYTASFLRVFIAIVPFRPLRLLYCVLVKPNSSYPLRVVIYKDENKPKASKLV
jgi:hypothetical protein